VTPGAAPSSLPLVPTAYPPRPDALALAALVVETLDELTPDAIESAAQRARKQRTQTQPW